MIRARYRAALERLEHRGGSRTPPSCSPICSTTCPARSRSSSATQARLAARLAEGTGSSRPRRAALVPAGDAARARSRARARLGHAIARLENPRNARATRAAPRLEADYLAEPVTTRRPSTSPRRIPGRNLVLAWIDRGIAGGGDRRAPAGQKLAVVPETFADVAPAIVDVSTTRRSLHGCDASR